MRTIRTLIVDDEPLARKTVRLLLANDPEVAVVGECRNGKEAAIRIVEEKPDLVFLDIQMPQMNGFEVIEAVGPKSMPGIVFVTAYDSYALKAFEAQALDYLLKPFDDRRFAKALQRAKDILDGADHKAFNNRLARLSSFHQGGRQFQTRLLLRTRSKGVMLDVSDVVWIQAADYCVKIHTTKATYVHRQPIKQLEQRLDPSEFFRSHRSALVNLGEVKELRPIKGGDYRILLSTGDLVKLSRTRKKKLEALLS